MKTSSIPVSISDLPHGDLLRLLLDFVHRIILHHGLWFAEISHQMGQEKAMAALGKCLDTSLNLHLKRLSETLNFELVDGMPKALAALSRDQLLELIDALGKIWIANDGLWFQAIEFDHGMNDAKRCNDSCWGHFSPFEAWSIKRFLGLGEAPGLEGLAQALHYRVYARLNRQSIIWENEKSLIFQMNACRVQIARNRKGLADYPCKSGGLVEYTYFAEAVDTRIKTQCIGCPPDAHPDTWYCAWRFTMD
ncbi:MAG: DUF6125 family protein [Pseudomonadota bacterium]